MASRQIKVTLDEATFAAIDRLSLATGHSRSALVASLLSPNAAAILATAEAFEMAATLRQQLSTDVGDMVEHARHRVSEQAQIADFDPCTDDMAQIAESGPCHDPHDTVAQAIGDDGKKLDMARMRAALGLGSNAL